MTNKTELIVALDFNNGDAALQCMQALKNTRCLFKIGLELFSVVGPMWVKVRTAEGYRIFLDLKFHDIPNTVAQAALQAQLMGVEMFTLHLAGGEKMIRETRAALENSDLKRPKILGVTVLTSFDESQWSQTMHVLSGKPTSVSSSVSSLFQVAKDWGVDGVVCSPKELLLLKATDMSLYSVVPGIRPAGAELGDQARVATPSEAAKLGASAIVVGRPITQAKDPLATTLQIQKELGV